jgi:hypothetical protein
VTRDARDVLANILVASAYVAGTVSALTFDQVFRDDPGPSVWFGVVASWFAVLVGALAASWKRGVFALPSALIAFASPLAILIATAVMWLGWIAHPAPAA